MTKKERAFIATVWAFAAKSGRNYLPWRRTTDPYQILVSELMLQQTQVERVIPRYANFLESFPTVEALSKANLGQVLKLWQGLGYNRRAKFLWEASKIIMSEHQGVFPETFDQLKTLPGIGPYTAAAVLVFSYNKPFPLIETNIRTVYIHHFFTKKVAVSDDEIMSLITKTLATDNPRAWFGALMDYGTYLKKTQGNVSRQSAHYTKQSVFKGSDREIRGAIITRLSTENNVTLPKLKKTCSFEAERLEAQISVLIKESLVIKTGHYYRLP